MVFDPLSSAEALSNFVLTLILHPDRLARVNQQTISLNDYLEAIRTRLFNAQRYEDGYTNQLAMIPQKVFVIHLIKLVKNKATDHQVAAMAMATLDKLSFDKRDEQDWQAHHLYLTRLIDTLSDRPEVLELPSIAAMPPGSPIGCGR